MKFIKSFSIAIIVLIILISIPLCLSDVSEKFEWLMATILGSVLLAFLWFIVFLILEEK